MDESALREQLRRIRYRQYLILVLLVVPYLVVGAEYVGYAVAGVFYTLLAVVGFGAFVVYRRRNRTGAGQ